MKDQLTILNVLPLGVLPVGSAKVLELVLNIRLPSDVRVIEFIILALRIRERTELVSKHTLGDEATGVGSRILIEVFT